MNLLTRWFDSTVLDLGRQLRWSFLPPLMIYLAAGISGITAIVGTFFVKEYLGLSAAFLSGLGFWAGLPWALKMPLGHLVDLIWRWKGLLVYLGAALVTASLAIMYALVTRFDTMSAIMSVEAWYVLNMLLAPCGYVVQDAVADAMSVEAVPRTDLSGATISETDAKQLHTTMQTLGRVALIFGLVCVALVNIYMFAGVEQASHAAKAEVYARIYLLALTIPAISISGVLLAAFLKQRHKARLRHAGLSESEVHASVIRPGEKTQPNYWYFAGGIAFVILTLVVGLGGFRFSQEMVFLGSMTIVVFLMSRLLRELEIDKARALVGTAIIIFVFRAVPLPGPGTTWFEIDVLGFDQQFISVLTLITAGLTLTGMIVLRPLIASRSIVHIVALLTIASGILALPNIGLFYSLHHWTAPLTLGVVDARFIAILDTAIESPLGQIAMIPMLAWIARNAPDNLKATFFAVMASFTNLALSASSLLTRYLNQLFVVAREVRDPVSDVILVAANYKSLGWLLITAALISVLAPLITIAIVQQSRFRTQD